MERQAVVITAKDIIITANDADGIARRFFFTPDIVRGSKVLHDLALDFSRDGVLAAMDVSYPGTLTYDSVEALNTLAPVLVRISDADEDYNSGRNHTDILTSMGVRIGGRNSVPEKMALLLLFGFFNYFDMHVPLKLLVETFAHYALNNNESWFDLRVSNKPVGTSRLLETPSVCVACNVAMAEGTCQQCATRVQVCSATCLDKVHAVCAPFSFVMPSGDELSSMQNILFPATFDDAALTTGFNMDERQAIIRVYSMVIWMDSSWYRNEIPYAVHRIRWAYVTRRLPNRMPLAPEPHPRENEAREVALSLALFHVYFGIDHTLRQPDIVLTEDTLCDLLMHLKNMHINPNAKTATQATLEIFCVRFQYMAGLRYLWKGDQPSTLDQCLHVLRCVSSYGGSEEAARLAMASPLLTAQRINLYHIQDYLVRAIENNQVALVRIMLEDGRVDLEGAHRTVNAHGFANTGNAEVRAMVRKAYAERPIEAESEED